MREFKVIETTWEDSSHELAVIRRQVFVIEQNVPEDLEWDGIDPQCRHVVSRDFGGRPIGTARLLPDGHIGRMAVLHSWRGKGVGGAMLECLLTLARQAGYAHVMLNAQTQAMPFYAKYGFQSEGDAFMDAGIPHRAMRLNLSTVS